MGTQQKGTGAADLYGCISLYLGLCSGGCIFLLMLICYERKILFHDGLILVDKLKRTEPRFYRHAVLLPAGYACVDIS
jgi:hypothetical protein